MNCVHFTFPRRKFKAELTEGPGQQVRDDQDRALTSPNEPVVQVETAKLGNATLRFGFSEAL